MCPMRRMVVFLLLVSSPLLAGGVKRIPVANWTVPPTGSDSAISGRATFVAVSPCRIADTRNPTGPYGGPAMTGQSTRTFNIPGGPCTGIPAAAAYSLNFAVVNFASGGGFIAAYPSGGTRPLVATLTYGPDPSYAVTNAAIVAANGSGSIDVYASANTQLIIDINGYFAEPAITGITAGTGMSVTGSGNVTVGINTTGAAGGQVLTFNGSSTAWILPPQGTITAVNAGTGLSGGATSGPATLNVNFAGSGIADTAARSDHTHYARTIIVSPGATATQGGTALMNAIAGITTASATNPFLVKVEPGVYDVGAASFSMKSYVDVEGSGEGVTTIHGTGFDMINLAPNAALRRLTVDGAQSPVEATSGPTAMDHVTVRSTSSGSASAAFYGNGGNHILNDVTVVLSSTGGSALVATQNGAASSLNLVLHHCTLSSTGTGTGQMQGIQASGANIEAQNLAITVVATGTAHAIGISDTQSSNSPSTIKVRGFAITATNENVMDGVFQGGGSSMDLADGTFAVSGGTGGSTGILSIDSSLRLRNVVLTVANSSASSTGLVQFAASAPRTIVVQNSEVSAASSTSNTSGDNITVQITGSKLEGGPVVNGTIPTQCAFNTDENLTPFTNTCP